MPLQHGLTLLPAADNIELSDTDNDSTPPQTPGNAPQPGAIDPNKTQSWCGDSSDEEGSHAPEGTVLHGC